MSVMQDFKAFIQRGNVVDLAVAVVIGGAFGKIVTALVEGFVMPLVSYVLPQGEWQTFLVGKFKVGALMGAMVDFVVIAFVVFLVLVKGLGSLKKKEPEPEAPATKPCPMCLEQIPAAAKRCRFCTSDQP